MRSSLANQWTTATQKLPPRLMWCTSYHAQENKVCYSKRCNLFQSSTLHSTRMANTAVQPWKRISTAILHTYELSISNDIVLWGIRVVIPTGLRTNVLDELHHMHTGIVKMKSLARLRVWWPGLDKDIEEMYKQCTPGLQKRPNPSPAPLHPWQFPKKPWQRRHNGFAGPFLNKMWFVIVDAHSKWLEVFCVNCTTTHVVSKKLEETFARYDIPEQLVSDDGRQFTSDEFHEFMKVYNINDVTSSPYHAKSNGESERFIRTFKEKILASELPLPKRLLQFLFRYRSTPHSTTSVSPSELLNGRLLLQDCHWSTLMCQQQCAMHKQNRRTHTTRIPRRATLNLTNTPLSKHFPKMTRGGRLVSSSSQWNQWPTQWMLMGVSWNAMWIKYVTTKGSTFTFELGDLSDDVRDYWRTVLTGRSRVTTFINKMERRKMWCICLCPNPYIHATSDVVLDRHQSKWVSPACFWSAHTLNHTQSTFLE